MNRGHNNATRWEGRRNEPSSVWKRVRPGTYDQCWPWTGAVSDFGHGYITVGGKLTYAHRMAWIASFGYIPKGLCVLHKCDVPACCNPLHLFLGTKGDNNRDSRNKGRRLVHGEHSGKAKLRDDVVRWIRSNVDRVSIAEMSRRLGVSTQTVWCVVHRRTWKHVEVA